MDMNRDLDTKETYFSYLLRVWRFEKDEGLSTSKVNLWRVSLESTRTRTRVTFTSLEDLLFFLQEQLKPKDQSPNDSKENSMREKVR